MEIDHVSFSSSGGAGLVAKTLAETQSMMGHDSKLISLFTKNIHEQPFRKPLLTLAAFADDKIIKSPATKTMVSLLRSNLQLLDETSLRHSAILNLHWNQGLIDNSRVSEFLRQGKKVVWTLHDMAPYTSVCHYSHACLGYETNCGTCPEVRDAFKGMVAKKFVTKTVFSQEFESLRIVCPSSWMAGSARSSKVFSQQRIEVVENPINQCFFGDYSREAARARLGIEPDEIVCAVIATSLDDPVKQVSELSNSYFQALESIKVSGKLLLIGSGGAAFSRANRNTLRMGSLSSESIASHLIAADFLASFSQAESAGMTIREAGALGVPAISFANPGALEQIEHGNSGMIFRDLLEFKALIKAVAQGTLNLREMGAIAKKLATATARPDVVAKKYLRIYEELRP